MGFRRNGSFLGPQKNIAFQGGFEVDSMVARLDVERFDWTIVKCATLCVSRVFLLLVMSIFQAARG